jgi:hypothetical protein
VYSSFYTGLLHWSCKVNECTGNRLHEAGNVTMMFCAATPCRNVGRYRRFGRTYCLHLHDLNCFPKHWYIPTSLHGVTAQKNNMDILTAARTSNLRAVLLTVQKKEKNVFEIRVTDLMKVCISRCMPVFV